MGDETLDWLLPADLNSEIARCGDLALRAYLEGAKRDATFSKLHNTLRFSQADQRWLLVLKVVLRTLDSKSWIYREGRRRVWVLESTYKNPTPNATPSRSEEIAFVRGYFDAEGGVPRRPNDRFYIQLVQKNLVDLEQVHALLRAQGIQCGCLHNPSSTLDPHYWRFYVRARSHRHFWRRVGSWHPRKRETFHVRFGPRDPQRVGDNVLWEKE